MESLSTKRLELIRADFAKALGSLDEAVREARSELEVDGAIQRFEFTFELHWKLLKLYLEHRGIMVRTPRDAFKESYAIGLLTDEETCLQMLEDRNATVHMYDRAASRQIFERIARKYVSLFKASLDKAEKPG